MKWPPSAMLVVSKAKKDNVNIKHTNLHPDIVFYSGFNPPIVPIVFRSLNYFLIKTLLKIYFLSFSLHCMHKLSTDLHASDEYSIPKLQGIHVAIYVYFHFHFNARTQFL